MVLLGERSEVGGRKVVAAAVLLLVGAVLGVVAAFSGRWFAEAVAGSYEVRAVVTVHDSETTEGQNGPSTTWRSEALAEGGRALRLPGDEAFGLAEPVVVRLSSLTDRVLAVRGADGGLVKFHDLSVKAVLMPLGAVAVLIAGWVLIRARRWVAREFRAGSAYAVVGALLAAAVVLTPAGLGRGAFAGATTVPVTDLSQVDLRRGTPPPVVERGGVARPGDVTVRVLDVRHGAPAGAAQWSGEFDVLAVLVEETRPAGAQPVAVRLVADRHGAPERVADCAGAPGALTDAPSAPGTRTGLLCFAVPPGFAPSYLLLGTLEDRVLLTL
ncbi:hypothetical protein AB0425_08580 [Actinosynnema sp. NPDC051121]